MSRCASERDANIPLDAHESSCMAVKRISSPHMHAWSLEEGLHSYFADNIYLSSTKLACCAQSSFEGLDGPIEGPSICACCRPYYSSIQHLTAYTLSRSLKKSHVTQSPVASELANDLAAAVRLQSSMMPHSAIGLPSATRSHPDVNRRTCAGLLPHVCCTSGPRAVYCAILQLICLRGGLSRGLLSWTRLTTSGL